MANLAARFRESLAIMCECPDPQEKALAQELQGYISQYDSAQITESALDDLLSAMEARIDPCMVRTIINGIRTVPTEVEALSVPPTKPSTWTE